eukprot:gene6920-6769_t
MARFELQKLYIDGGYSDAGSDATSLNNFTRIKSVQVELGDYVSVF